MNYTLIAFRIKAAMYSKDVSLSVIRVLRLVVLWPFTRILFLFYLAAG